MPDLARPSNVRPLVEGKVYEAVKAFVLEFAQPALEADRVIQGWQNVAGLPAGREDYVVVSIMSDKQRGTAVQDWSVDEETEIGTISVGGLVELLVQVDFCSKNDLARARARRFAIMARTDHAVGHFRQWGISSLYSEDVKDLSFVGDAQRYVRRYMTTLHLSMWEGDALDYEYFTRVEPHVENVDVHHPANRGE